VTSSGVKRTRTARAGAAHALGATDRLENTGLVRGLRTRRACNAGDAQKVREIGMVDEWIAGAGDGVGARPDARLRRSTVPAAASRG
jgi:hypothetical protein